MPELLTTTDTVRGRILASAIQLFVDQGYHVTTIPDIVASSKTSIGAVYHHFSSKEELARELHQQVIQEFMRQAEESVLPLASAKDRIRAYVDLLFSLTEKDSYFVAYLLHARPRVVVDDNLTVCSREGIEVTNHIIADGKAKGELRDEDDRILCGVISGIIMRLVDLRLDGLIVEPLPTLADKTTDSIWRAVRA
jgi:AcrR family transcriptional regulator